MSLFHSGLILVPFWLEYLIQIPLLELLFFSFSIIFSSKLNFCLWNLPTTSRGRMLSRYSHEFHFFSSSSDSASSSTSTKCYPGTCRGPEPPFNYKPQVVLFQSSQGEPLALQTFSKLPVLLSLDFLHTALLPPHQCVICPLHQP